MKVLTAVVNNPIFIEIQYFTLKKYMNCHYEFIVINDAKTFADVTNGGDLTIRKKIEDTCAKLGIKCINVDNSHHSDLNMSCRHADTFNKYVLTYQKENPDKYLLLDSDMFLIDNFDMKLYSRYKCAIVLQSRSDVHYFWPGLVYMDFTNISDIDLLDWSCSPGLDSGGMMRHWLDKQNCVFPKSEEIRWKNNHYHDNNVMFIRHLWSCSWNESELPNNLKDSEKLLEFFKSDPRNQRGNFFCEIYDNKFLHYRAGGNWMNEGLEIHMYLSEKLKQILC
jgi:hypothetical protein